MRELKAERTLRRMRQIIFDNPAKEERIKSIMARCQSRLADKWARERHASQTERLQNYMM